MGNTKQVYFEGKLNPGVMAPGYDAVQEAFRTSYATVAYDHAGYLGQHPGEPFFWGCAHSTSMAAIEDGVRWLSSMAEGFVITWRDVENDEVHREHWEFGQCQDRVTFAMIPGLEKPIDGFTAALAHEIRILQWNQRTWATLAEPKVTAIEEWLSTDDTGRKLYHRVMQQFAGHIGNGVPMGEVFRNLTANLLYLGATANQHKAEPSLIVVP